MKDLRETSYVLGIKIYRDRKYRLLALSQASYVDKVCWIGFNNFYVGFLNMLVFQTVWRNKNEHKTKIKMEKEEKSVFKFTRNLPTYDYEALHPSRF